MHDSAYEAIKDGHIQISFDCQRIDAITAARIMINLHRIAQKVALVTLYEHTVSFPVAHVSRMGSPENTYFRLRPLANEQQLERELSRVDYDDTPFPLVRLDISNLRTGSLYMDVLLMIQTTLTLSHSDYRAVLQGLAGNILYAMIRSGLNRVREVRAPILRLPIDTSNNLNNPSNRHIIDREDPFDVGTNIRDIVNTALMTNERAASRIRIKQVRNEDGGEIDIRIQ